MRDAVALAGTFLDPGWIWGHERPEQPPVLEELRLHARWAALQIRLARLRAVFGETGDDLGIDRQVTEVARHVGLARVRSHAARVHEGREHIDLLVARRGEGLMPSNLHDSRGGRIDEAHADRYGSGEEDAPTVVVTGGDEVAGALDILGHASLLSRAARAARPAVVLVSEDLAAVARVAVAVEEPVGGPRRSDAATVATAVAEATSCPDDVGGRARIAARAATSVSKVGVDAHAAADLLIYLAGHRAGAADADEALAALLVTGAAVGVVAREVGLTTVALVAIAVTHVCGADVGARAVLTRHRPSLKGLARVTASTTVADVDPQVDAQGRLGRPAVGQAIRAVAVLAARRVAAGAAGRRARASRRGARAVGDARAIDVADKAWTTWAVWSTGITDAPSGEDAAPQPRQHQACTPKE